MTFLALLIPVALAATPPEHTLTYDISIGGKAVGTRTLTVRYETDDGATQRVLESFTDIDATVIGQSLRFRERLTGFAGNTPASFHAVIEENGSPREVQAGWRPQGWTLTTVSRTRARTSDVPSYSIDISTVDLMDPGTRYPMERFETLKLLSAETGDIWQGDVSRLGADTVKIGATEIDVSGFSWASPEGPTRFWYDGEGYLVRYEMRVLGVRVEATLREPPPAGPDAFPVGLGSAKVDGQEL